MLDNASNNDTAITESPTPYWSSVSDQQIEYSVEPFALTTFSRKPYVSEKDSDTFESPANAHDEN